MDEHQMNRLEIFQQVYGTDYVFTVKEIERLRQVTELIVRECISACATDRLGKTAGAEELIKEHFGVEE